MPTIKSFISQVRAVEQLLSEGEVEASALADLQAGARLGLWAVSRDGRRAVATATLVKLLGELPTPEEVTAAVFACEPDLRRAWLRTAAARLRELGGRRDVDGLAAAITTLGAAAEGVNESLAEASLQPTGRGELETALFGAAVEQATATPRLLRALGATGALVEDGSGAVAASLADINPEDPSVNWVRGRVLQLPRFFGASTATATSVLSGNLTETAQGPAMRWVLRHPWAFLLAQIVFAQEAWAAERVSGGIALEIEPAQIDRFQHPPQVLVVVTTAAGEEVACGTLGELIGRVLEQLGVALLAPRMGRGAIDDRIAPIIGMMLRREVWRFDGRLRGGRAGYTIHEAFSDECYRAYGSRHFYRLGSAVTHAIRNVAEVWAGERMAQSGRRAS